MKSSDQVLVAQLTRSRLYREYETAFRGAVGLPLAFTAVETWSLQLHGDRNESPFCHLLATTNQACAAQLQFQAQLRHDAANHTATATGFSGLCESAVPVKLGARLMGFLHTGQVFPRAPLETDFQRTLQTLAAWGVRDNRDELRAAYFATQTVARTQYQAILGLLGMFADQLATMSNQVLVMEQAAENPQIARVREFIQQRMADDIHVSDCARIALMSRFYFCKCFKRATGMPFTEYLSRLRTERAKLRLLVPHLRASEVAFEVGFQSLSQFNRVFKRVTGQCPTAYRTGLANAASPHERSAASGQHFAPGGNSGNGARQRHHQGSVARPRLVVA